MDHKPKNIIKQARGKAEKALLETCGGEIQRICGAFSHDTGLQVTGVNFNTVDVRAIGVLSPSLVLNLPTLEHEDA